MAVFKYIFFDCMETLIDLHELPSRSDYARWAFQGSGVEGYWRDFEDFLMLYEASKADIAAGMMPDQDSGIELRHAYVVKL